MMDSMNIIIHLPEDFLWDFVAYHGTIPFFGLLNLRFALGAQIKVRLEPVYFSLGRYFVSRM